MGNTPADLRYREQLQRDLALVGAAPAPATPPAPKVKPFERVIRQALETGRIAPEDAATYDRPDLVQLWRDQEDDATLLGEAFIADALAHERYGALSGGLGRALRAAFLLGYSFGEARRDDEERADGE